MSRLKIHYGTLIRIDREEFHTHRKQKAIDSFGVPLIACSVAIATLSFLEYSFRTSLKTFDFESNNYGTIIGIFTLSLSLLIPVDRAIKDREKRLVTSLEKKSVKLKENIYELATWYRFGRGISLLVTFSINLISASQILIMIIEARFSLKQCFLASLAFLASAIVNKTYFNADWPEEIESIDGFLPAIRQVERASPRWLERKFKELSESQIKVAQEMALCFGRQVFVYKKSSILLTAYATIPFYIHLANIFIKSDLNIPITKEKLLIVFAISIQATTTFALIFFLGKAFSFMSSFRISDMCKTQTVKNSTRNFIYFIIGLFIFILEISLSVTVFNIHWYTTPSIHLIYGGTGIATLAMIAFRCLPSAIDELVKLVHELDALESIPSEKLRTDFTAEEVHAILDLVLDLRKQGEFILPAN
ncbi:hypothetical protein QVA66_10375 [Staphylococcus chromogenes]|nr:hypothetical protein [Staphylococcus chromogenes]